MNDTFKTYSRSLTAPPECAEAISPDDSGTLSHVTRALYVGNGGDICMRTLGGSVVTMANVPAGTFLPIRVVQIMSSGTTASEILGLW